MKRSNVLKTWAMIAALALPMVACDEDEPGIDDKPTVDPSTYGLLILNRGNYNANNASLNLYDIWENRLRICWYMVQRFMWV